MILSIGILIIILAIILMQKLFNISLKLKMIIILVLACITTGSLIITKPTMHKPISISIVDYLIKFNTDGSITTTKTTTSTKIKSEGK